MDRHDIMRVDRQKKPNEYATHLIHLFSKIGGQSSRKFAGTRPQDRKLASQVEEGVHFGDHVRLYTLTTSAAVGGHGPWWYLLMSLTTSAVLLLSGRQDRSLGSAWGEFLSLFMAVFALVAMVLKALFSAWWMVAVIALVALGTETWLINRWRSTPRSR